MNASQHFVPSAEAAFIAGLTQQQMNRMADEHLVPDSLLAHEDGARRFARITAAFANFFFAADSLLVAAARKAILTELTARVACSQSSEHLLSLQGMPKDIDWTFIDSRVGLSLDFTHFVREAVARAKEVDTADALVTKVDGVMGGEPCFKGTRLPIDVVLTSLDKDISDERILDEYSLTKEQLNAARVYALVHPRRGRPRRLGAAPFEKGQRMAAVVKTTAL